IASQDALLSRARSLAGVTNPVDEAYWFGIGVTFHYRSSPSPMLASRGWVTDNDPPFDLPGMRRVILDARGDVVAAQQAPQPRLPAKGAARFAQLWYVVLLALPIAAGAVLAVRNLRAGRLDRTGAVRVALWVFVCDAAAGILMAHHPPSVDAEGEVLTA